MAVLTNKSIASTYKSVLSIGATTESALTTSIQQLTDGLGNSSPLSMSTTQIQFNNDANTFSFPATRGTSGQILKLADANGTLSWADDDLSNTLDFSGGTGTGSVTLDTQTLAFTGTANQIETSASSQAITLSFPTAGVTLPDGSVATTQTANDDSTKVATTAYVEAAVAAGGVGNVTKTGTPSTNEVAIWTNSNTIKGDASFTMSSSTFQINNSTASSQSNLIISNNDTAINSIPANIIFNSNTLTSYKTLAQIYATKTDADIANASGKLNFSTTDAGVPSVKFIINSNGLSEFFGNVNAYNTSSLKLYSLGQEGYSNTEFLEIKKSSTNAIFNVNKVGTGSVRGLEFQTGGSPKLTISSGGNVGIGTDSPSAKLSVYTTAFGGNTAGSGGAIDLGVGSTKYWQFRLDTANSGDFKLDKTYSNVWSTPLSISRSSGAATFSSNVTTGGTLTVNGTGSSAFAGQVFINGLANYTGLTLTGSGGSRPAINFNNVNNGVLGSIFGTEGNELIISANGISALTISSGGKVGIGTVPSEMLHIKSTSSPEVRLEGAGHSWYIRAYNDNYNVYSPSGRQNVSYLNNGDVRNYNNSTTWQTSSDVRVKENINTISDATSKVLALNPVIYDYKQEFAEKNNWDNDKKINNVGFIAQEFESVFPKYVSTNECVIGETTIDDFKSIDTGHLVAYLVKAIQEQQTIIEDLKLRIETLEG